MVDKVARLHFQHASPAGALRALSGWLIAITGLALLVAQLVRSVEGFDLAVSGAVAGGAMAAAATALGAVPLLVVRQIGASVQGMLLGFGAGVMLAASVFSLLLPGFDAALVQTGSETGAALLIAFGVLLGAGGLLAMDRALPHTHFPEGRRSGAAVWLFVFAIAVHNIPEGLAIGVAAGPKAQAPARATRSRRHLAAERARRPDRRDRPGGGGLRSLARLRRRGGVGLIEPIAAIAGSMMVSVSATILPWGLAGAAARCSSWSATRSSRVAPPRSRDARHRRPDGGLRDDDADGYAAW